ncbi:hypothetical protein CVS40_1647 [Lucilia cuprina]|nr:hypothetical protein CVS40_1647 [Lucilia cuprina]
MPIVWNNWLTMKEHSAEQHNNNNSSNDAYNRNATSSTTQHQAINVGNTAVSLLPHTATLSVKTSIILLII